MSIHSLIVGIVSEEQKQTFRGDPKAYMDYRKDIESEINSRFKFVRARCSRSCGSSSKLTATSDYQG